VERAGPAGGYGNLVTVRHADGTVTAYGHMRVVTVAPGDAVGAGQLIAEVGSEGRSTGPHLHFEVRTPEGTRDPRPWFAERGVAL
jgi:murein DD-endopeptidase MepM/ murein hydrolase activator NlpD